MRLSRADVAVLVAATGWSSTGIFGRLLPFNPWTTVGLRTEVGAVVVGLLLLAGGKGLIFSRWSFLGAVLAVPNVILFSYALIEGDLTVTYAFFQTSVLFGLLAGRIALGKRPSQAAYLWGAGVVVGVFCLFWKGQIATERLYGSLWGLVAAIAVAAWGTYGVWLRKRSATASQELDTALLLAFLGGIPMFVPSIAAEFHPADVTPTQWVIILAMGIVGGGCARLFSWGSSRSSPGRALTLKSVESVLGVLWVSLFLGADLTPLKIGAAAVTLICGVMVLRAENRGTK